METLLPAALLAGFAAALVASALHVWRGWRVRETRRGARVQLAAALESLAVAVLAGSVARAQFGVALQETLEPLCVALSGAEREWFALAIAIGHQTDSDPQLLLRRLRERCEQEDAQRAQVSALAQRAHRQAWGLGVLPLLVLGVLLLARPAPLFGSRGGAWFWLLWLALAALQCAGFVALERRLRRLRWTGYC